MPKKHKRARVLIACETSGMLRQRFARLGHVAVSVDLLPADDGAIEGTHRVAPLTQDILNEGWDLIVAHPPCTCLAASGLHWNRRIPGRAERTAEAINFVRMILDAPCPRIAVENPVGALGTAIRPADQIVQPYQFGDDASKRTALWLKGLPLLRARPEDRVPGRWVRLPSGREVERWANQLDSGQNRLAPSPDRWKQRSKTYPGIADAMVRAWAPTLAAI